jgi:pimeloyl-ACP methyl ester carboxylesterase
MDIIQIADGDPVPFHDHGNSPLDGVRVLDFTHVLAGPSSAHALAAYGAAVLHISSPWFADSLAQHLGVDAGEYDAYLDLRYDKDMETMRRLAATADVFASTYRPAVNERFGLLPGQLADASGRAPSRVVRIRHAAVPPGRQAQLQADFARNNPRDMRRGLLAYLDWLRRDDDPARRLAEAGVPAWVMHAEKGDGGLTPNERAALETCPRVRVVTVPGEVFFLPNDVPERIADVIVQALAET